MQIPILGVLANALVLSGYAMTAAGFEV